MGMDHRRGGGLSRGLRLALRGLGEVALTIGAVLLLFVVYQLFYTNLEANRAQDRVRDELLRSWQPSQGDEPGTGKPTRVRLGRGFALMRIPRLGATWEKPIIQGVRLSDLAKGVGHEPGKGSPGVKGNFVVAGHRATNGEPFAYLDRLRAGDSVTVETVDAIYRYRVFRREIVQPDAVEVMLPVPYKPRATPSKSLLTLVTCNPRWASTQRLIVYTELASTITKSQDAKAIGAGALRGR